MQASPATVYETINAGPAVLRAASPVATKMPAPITAPMPNAVSVTGPSARFSRLSLCMSANSVFSDLVANICLRSDIQPTPEARNEKTAKNASLSMFVAMLRSSGKRVFFLAREIHFDDREKILTRRDARDMRSEKPRATLALGVVAAEFPHQQRAFLFAKSLAHQLVVPQHARLLFLECRLRRNRLAA